MEFDWAEWGPPLAVMLAAAGAGGFFAMTLRRDDRDTDAIQARGRTEDLKGQRSEALEALAALETQKESMAPEDYAAERKALLEKGASAMRELEEAPSATPSSQADALAAGIASLTTALKNGEIDEVTYAKAVAALSEQAGPAQPSSKRPGAPTAPASSAPAPADSPPAVNPAWTGAIYAVAGLALVGGLVYYASQNSRPRVGDDGMTGGDLVNQGAQTAPGPGQGGMPPWMTEKIAAAKARLEANPKDIGALNELTQLHLQQPAEAWKYNEQAREVDANDVDARMYNGVITGMMGMPDKALEKFAAIVAEHPDHAPTWAWKGITHAEMQQWPETIEAIEKAKSLGVQHHTLDETLALARSGGQPSQAPPLTPAQRATPPGQVPPQAGNSAVIASGVVDIDPNRKNFRAQTLFVYVRPKGVAAGPPIAAKQLPPGPYPLAFKITEADRPQMGPMSSQPVPGEITVSVRLDADGNAFTKDAADPQGSVDTAKGSTGLTLRLQ